MIKHYTDDTMSVGELKKALKGLADDTPVVIDLNMKENNNSDFAFAAKARYYGNTMISSPEFMIHCGKGYDY